MPAIHAVEIHKFWLAWSKSRIIVETIHVLIIVCTIFCLDAQINKVFLRKQNRRICSKVLSHCTCTVWFFSKCWFATANFSNMLFTPKKEWTGCGLVECTRWHDDQHMLFWNSSCAPRSIRSNGTIEQQQHLNFQSELWIHKPNVQWSVGSRRLSVKTWYYLPEIT